MADEISVKTALKQYDGNLDYKGVRDVTRDLTIQGELIFRTLTMRLRIEERASTKSDSAAFTKGVSWRMYHDPRLTD